MWVCAHAVTSALRQKRGKEKSKQQPQINLHQKHIDRTHSTRTHSTRTHSTRTHSTRTHSTRTHSKKKVGKSEASNGTYVCIWSTSTEYVLPEHILTEHILHIHSEAYEQNTFYTWTEHILYMNRTHSTTTRPMHEQNTFYTWTEHILHIHSLVTHRIDGIHSSSVVVPKA
jgi:hypothetical protein